MLIREVKTDPKQYRYRTKEHDDMDALDTDDKRHLIRPIIRLITEHHKGEEHLFCDPEQLDTQGKFRRPKIILEAERRGFKTVMEMVEADKKAEEDTQRRASLEKKAKEDARDKELAELKALVQQLLAKK
jgi:hypothetical protein